MNIKKHIPNFLTCCNLLCGCLGIIQVFQGQIVVAAYLIFAACVFDFFDGFAARALKVSSPIGKDLDSLADMVTFGALPGLIMYRTMQHAYVYSGVSTEDIVERQEWPMLLPYLALLIPVFSALRLAQFNNDTRQSDRFIGMPTPANALFIASFPFIFPSILLWLDTRSIDGIFILYILGVLSIVLSWLLVAELPLIALKFKNFGWADNKIRYILIISALLLVLTLNFTAIPIIIILYIILSIIENKFTRAKA